MVSRANQKIPLRGFNRSRIENPIQQPGRMWNMTVNSIIKEMWNMTVNYFAKGTEQEYFENKQEMNTIVFPREIHDVFVKNISSYLYVNDLHKLYGTCKDMKDQLHKPGIHIYNKICKHRQPWYKEGKLHRDGDLPAVESDSGRYWYKEGKLHRDGDLPAYIDWKGSQYWYKEGKLHRDGDLPAIILSNGNQHWYTQGKLHRDGDLPAIESDRGRYWYTEGKCHRDGDSPAVIELDGCRYWFKQGKCHRDGDLPAYIEYEDCYWFKQGKLHRDGNLPAIIFSYGDVRYWFKQGKLHRDVNLPPQYCPNLTVKIINRVILEICVLTKS
jgi:hypothetical protein